jgi:citrate lyase subunit beta/citryl-CoA lyase
LARATIASGLRTSRAGRVYVRINAVSEADRDPDLDALRGCPLDGIVAPKIDSAEEVRELDQRLALLERRQGRPPGSLEAMPIVETAAGAENCNAIAAASARVLRMIFCATDYTLDLDLQWTHDEQALGYARARLAHASRFAGLESPIDTATLDVRDIERFISSPHNGRRLGFQGKLCPHPAQIEPCHAVFTPSKAEVERARRIVAAFDEAGSRGSAAIDAGAPVPRIASSAQQSAFRRVEIGRAHV